MFKTRAKWDSLDFSIDDFWMIWMCHGIPFLLYFIFLIFLFRKTVKRKTWMRAIYVVLKVTWDQLFKVLSRQLRGKLRRHLKDTFQLKILGRWINISAKSFFGIKHHQTKMGESAWEVIISTKIRDFSSKNIAPRHFAYYCCEIYSHKTLFFYFSALVNGR